MQFYKNRNGELEFYGHKQSHPFDFPFLKADSILSVLIQGENELRELLDIFKGEVPKSFALYSISQAIIDSSESLILPLAKFEPDSCSLLLVLSELSDEAEQLLRSIAISQQSFFSIADLYRKASPSATRQFIRFRGIDFSVFESVEIPAYFTNWAYINYLHQFIVDRKYKTVLDMFAGSGAIGFSIAAVLQGVRVDSLDANIHAVRSMRETLKNNPELFASVTLSECFGALRSNETKFDIIVGNPPHISSPIDYPGQINGRDPNFRIHHEFYSQAANFLNDGGRIVLVENAFSNVLKDFYPLLPKSLILEKVVRLPDQFWDIVIVATRENG